MKLAIFATIVGLAIGYSMGFGDATAGRSHVAARVMDSFGMTKMKAARDAREQRTQDATKG